MQIQLYNGPMRLQAMVQSINALISQSLNLMKSKIATAAVTMAESVKTANVSEPPATSENTANILASLISSTNPSKALAQEVKMVKMVKLRQKLQRTVLAAEWV